MLIMYLFLDRVDRNYVHDFSIERECLVSPIRKVNGAK